MPRNISHTIVLSQSRMMKQFNYRYQLVFGKWDFEDSMWAKFESRSDESICIERLEDYLYDDTFNCFLESEFAKYHNAGVPKKIALKWKIRKSLYTAYFWFEMQGTLDTFKKLYGMHRDTPADFIFHIDPINKKYEVSLYRYGLKESIIIPDSFYQLLVFKSGFENYRSKNYNQPHGAWVW